MFTVVATQIWYRSPLQDGSIQILRLLMRGSQQLHLYFPGDGTHESILDVTDLMGLTPRGDDIQGFPHEMG